MKVLMNDGINGASIIDVKQTKVIRKREVKIKVRYSMLSELDLYTSKKNYGRKCIPGFEFVGIIEELGDEAKMYGYRRGDRVTGIPIKSCGRCENCLNGKWNCCIAIEDNDGTLQEYLIRDYTQLFKVPDELDDREGCLIWPVAEALEAIEKSKVSIEKTVAIVGNGFTSLILGLISKLMSAKHVVVIGIGKQQEGIFKKVGIEYIDSSNLLQSQRVLLRNTCFMGFDSVIFATDNRELEWNFQAFTKPGGVFCLLSFKRLNYGISFESGGVLSRNIAIISSYLFEKKMKIATEVIPRIQLSKYIDFEYDFLNSNFAFEAIMKKKYSKVGIKF